MRTRLEKKRVYMGYSLADLGATVRPALDSAGVRWDDHIWRAKGGRGRIDYRSVYRLKLWWNHNGLGEVLTRSLRAQVERVEARLAHFPVRDIKYRRLNEHLTTMRTKLDALAPWPIARYAPRPCTSSGTAWRAECPHPELRVRLGGKRRLNSGNWRRACSIPGAKEIAFPLPLQDSWALLFETENDCWIWPECERRRAVDHQAGWDT
jgi:hypothetical protein